MDVPDNTMDTNHATYFMLRSYADTEFVRWVDYARDFAESLDGSCLSDGEKRAVMLVLNTPPC